LPPALFGGRLCSWCVSRGSQRQAFLNSGFNSRGDKAREMEAALHSSPTCGLSRKRGTDSGASSVYSIFTINKSCTLSISVLLLPLYSPSLLSFFLSVSFLGHGIQRRHGYHYFGPPARTRTTHPDWL